MKLRKHFILIISMISCNLSLNAAEETRIYIPQRMINPPILPFHREEFVRGFKQGIITPFLGMAWALVSDHESLIQSYADYYTFRNKDSIPKWVIWCSKNEDSLQQKYIAIKKNLAEGNHLEVNRLVEEFNTSYNKEMSPLYSFDICDAHNGAYKHHAKRISLMLGVFIASTAVTAPFIIALLATARSQPKEICKRVCTQVCTPVGIEDLD